MSTLADRLRTELECQLVGVYLGGSLALGDFDPESSDLDIVVVTEQSLSDASVERLRDLHLALSQSHEQWAPKLEISYIPRRAVRRYDPQDCKHPTAGETWPFGIGHHDEGSVIQRWTVREHGLTVLGPKPDTLIDPVSAGDLRLATVTLLRDDWSRRLLTPDWFATRRYQAYGVLTMCRSEYTVTTGMIASKPAAAAWARTALPHRAALIDQGMAWRADPQTGDPSETLDFIAEVVGRHA